MDVRQSHVDLLIVGAGPAGLALANWFNGSGLRVRMIDIKPQATQRGQAEGLKSTTVEIFESFGVGNAIWNEAWRLEEIAIWGPDETGKLCRLSVMPDCVPELGKSREIMLQQARVEHHLLNNVESKGTVKVEWAKRPIELSIDDNTVDDDEKIYPVFVSIVDADRSSQTDGTSAMDGDGGIKTGKEHIHAKFIVGCDGAKSWIRRELGVKLEGDVTDSVFGVMDIVPKSNFPDIRKVCYLRSLMGTILLVPRSNKEVRLYVPVESGSTLCDPKDLSFEQIIGAARRIISPYKLDYGSCTWWSAYRVGQRVGDRFSIHERAFLAGDAVHTHSPKAGQGMNTSIQDANNLGWKLRLVLQRLASREILKTYETERRPIAQDLIAFDRGYLKLFSGNTDDFDTAFVQAQKFTTGLAIRYNPSALVQLPGDQTSHASPSFLKADLVPGKRLPDFQVVNQADAIRTRIHQRLTASGCFRIVVFAGDISQLSSFDRLQKLGTWLASSHGLGPLTNDATAMVEPLVVHCAPRAKIELLDLHEVFRPWSESEGYDYWRVYVDEENRMGGHGSVYERLEIDRERGCMAVVRPDGYLGLVTGIDQVEEIHKYFAAFVTATAMKQASAHQSPQARSNESEHLLV